nr:coat protein [Starmerella bacillaris totivirus 1]
MISDLFSGAAKQPPRAEREETSTSEAIPPDKRSGLPAIPSVKATDDSIKGSDTDTPNLTALCGFINADPHVKIRNGAYRTYTSLTRGEATLKSQVDEYVGKTVYQVGRRDVKFKSCVKKDSGTVKFFSSFDLPTFVTAGISKSLGRNAGFAGSITSADYTGIVYVLAAAVAHYASSGELTFNDILCGNGLKVRSVDNAEIPVGVNTSSFYMPRGVSDGTVLNVFDAIAAAVNSYGVTVYTDHIERDGTRVTINTATNALLAQQCWLGIKVLFSIAQSVGEAGPLALALTKGVHSVMTVVGHTDEGGFMRSVLRRGDYVAPYGGVFTTPEMYRDYNGLPMPRYDQPGSFAVLIDQIALSTAAAVSVCDPTVSVNGKTFPTVISGGQTIVTDDGVRGLMREFARKKASFPSLIAACYALQLNLSDVLAALGVDSVQSFSQFKASFTRTTKYEFPPTVVDHSVLNSMLNNRVRRVEEAIANFDKARDLVVQRRDTFRANYPDTPIADINLADVFNDNSIVEDAGLYDIEAFEIMDMLLHDVVADEVLTDRAVNTLRDNARDVIDRNSYDKSNLRIIAATCRPFVISYSNVLCDMFNVTKDRVDNMSSTLAASISSMDGDRHLAGETVAPYFWIEPTGILSRRYGTPAEDAGLGPITYYGSKTEQSLFERVEVRESRNGESEIVMAFTNARNCGLLNFLGSHRLDGLAHVRLTKFTADRFALTRLDNEVTGARARNAHIGEYTWGRGQTFIKAPAEMLYLGNAIGAVVTHYDNTSLLDDPQPLHMFSAAELGGSVTWDVSRLGYVGTLTMHDSAVLPDRMKTIAVKSLHNAIIRQQELGVCSVEDWQPSNVEPSFTSKLETSVDETNRASDVMRESKTMLDKPVVDATSLKSNSASVKTTHRDRALGPDVNRTKTSSSTPAPVVPASDGDTAPTSGGDEVLPPDVS